MTKFAVVIPAYNEENTIRDLAQRALKYCDLVIVVDDGSTDATSSRADNTGAVVLRNEQNLGKAGAMWRGMQFALSRNMERIVTLDGDGQHRPEDIPLLMEEAERNPASVIIGSRLHEKDVIPRRRYLANRFANFWIAWAAGLPLEDSQSGFRVYPAAFLEGLTLDTGKEKGFVFESEILIEAGWKGFRVIPVRIPAIYHKALRKSHFRPVGDIVKITRMVAARLFRRGMHPRGFYRAFIKPFHNRLLEKGFDRDAAFTFLLSLGLGVCTLGLSYLYLLTSVVHTAWHASPLVESTDAIAVPGNRLNAGKISADYEARLQRALKLFTAGDLSPQILILGGPVENRVSEAEAGAEWLAQKGVPPGKVSREEYSTNTLENFFNAREWLLEREKPVVVTNRYHLQRIRTLARGLGLKIGLVAAEDACRLSSSFPKMLKEAFFLQWYWTGRIYASITKNENMLKRIR